MPVLRRAEEGRSGFTIEARRQSQSVAYELSSEGQRFLMDVLRLRDGDEFSADDLDFLLDRGWATERRDVPLVAAPVAPPVPAIPPAPVVPPAPVAPPAEVRRPEPPTPAPTPPPEPARPPVADKETDVEKPATARTPASRRSRAREVALQILYQHEQNPSLTAVEFGRFLRRRLSDPALRDFTITLIDGVQSDQERIDRLISAVAENWRLDRMAAIDRNILRIGAYEILHGGDVPTKVAINEALELAKRYSTAQSSRFVNGILDRILPAAEEDAQAIARAAAGEANEPDAPAEAADTAPETDAPAEAAASSSETGPAPDA